MKEQDEDLKIKIDEIDDAKEFLDLMAQSRISDKLKLLIWRALESQRELKNQIDSQHAQDVSKAFALEQYFLYDYLIDRDLDIALAFAVAREATGPKAIAKIIGEMKKFQALKIDFAMKLARMGFMDSESLENERNSRDTLIH